MDLQKHLDEAIQLLNDAIAQEQAAYETRLVAQGRVATLQGLLAEEGLKEASQAAQEPAEGEEN